MNLSFSCTQCGKCCQGLKLPLSVDEAIDWSSGGNQVQLLSDARPRFVQPDSNQIQDLQGTHSFFAFSGDLAIEINVLLAAAFDGPCPHLKRDMLCGNYERRPRVCRIYPAEIAPHLDLDPKTKVCPTDAWSSSESPLISNGKLVSSETAILIDEHRAAALNDRTIKARACVELGFRRAALTNEGYAVHTPPPLELAEALRRARKRPALPDDTRQWQIVTNRASTLKMLLDARSNCSLTENLEEYTPFFPTDFN